MSEWIVTSIVLGIIYYAITKKFFSSLVFAVMWPVMAFYLIASLFWGIGSKF